MKCFSTIERKEIPPFATTQMDLEGIVLSEISQLEKDEYCMISPLMWNLNRKSNLKKQRRE